VEKTTTPPARYKEATLVKELENKGIGRPSTFTTIVETVLSSARGYCKIEDKCIVPTDLGLKLSKFLDDSFPELFSIGYTAEMEKDLDLISDGKLNWLDFLTNFHKKLEESAGKVSEAEKKCPECGKPMKIRKGPYGSFWGCTGYPNCKHIERTK
jgi:DNA topoisomerase-1